MTPEVDSAVVRPSGTADADRPLPDGVRSFAELLAPHLGPVRAVARRLLGCDHLAADALQETLLALWHSRAVPEDLPGWLIRAVVHRSLHLRRTLLRRRRHEQHAADHHCDLHRGCDNPLHIAWAHELGERIERALATLPADQRTAFELFECDGLDYASIAERLATPIGTVRSRLNRARATLRRLLADEAECRRRPHEPAHRDPKIAGRSPETVTPHPYRAGDGLQSAGRGDGCDPRRARRVLPRPSGRGRRS